MTDREARIAGHIDRVNAEESPRRKARGGVARGRYNGENNPRAKLTEADVLAIRESTESTMALTRKYGVSQICIYLIRRRLRWTHLPEQRHVHQP